MKESAWKRKGKEEEKDACKRCKGRGIIQKHIFFAIFLVTKERKASQGEQRPPRTGEEPLATGEHENVICNGKQTL